MDGEHGTASMLKQAADAFGAQQSLINEAMAGTNTAAVVQVKAVTNSGGLEAVGYVDVLPLVNQIGEDGKPTSHVTVHHLPYLRLQGGGNAIILDPVVGDIGLAVFASRDSSAVKKTKQQSNPGSRRRFSMADGFYLGGFLNKVPGQVVRFHAAGIDVVATGTLTLKASSVAIQSGALTHNGRNIGDTHKHNGVQSGGGTTGTPVP